jgi:AcrR family transcriptional regulator
MYENFERLDGERKLQIVNAALKEFSVKGYDEASTNIIAKEAGLSKGLLFHYVVSKRELFLYLYDYAMTKILDDFFGSLDLTQKDMLERCHQIAFVKIEVLHKNPALFDFFKTAIDTTSEEVAPDLEKKSKKYRVISFDKLFDGVDTSLFRSDIDPKKAINLCVWFLNGLADSLQHRVNNLRMDEIDYDALTAESNQYFEIMKKCFYKEGI